MTMISKIYRTAAIKSGLAAFARAGHNPARFLTTLDSFTHSSRPVAPEDDIALAGQWEGFRARHIDGAWFVIYREEGASLTLAAIAEARHA
jgi:mRNA-degrading endonuclease YafQ of YafQ-DinJ toxin-antitoxin module